MKNTTINLILGAMNNIFHKVDLLCEIMFVTLYYNGNGAIVISHKLLNSLTIFTTAKMGGLCEERSKKGRGGGKVERKGQQQGAK